MSQSTLSERPYVNSNLFSGHYLDERLRERDEWDCDDRARQAMDELRTLYDLEGDLVGGYGEDALIDNWIDEVLDVLGFGTQDEVSLPDGGGFVDELLFETPTDRRDAAKVYLDTEDTTDLFERGIGIVEAKQWDADFTVQFSEQRPYRNASHQTKHYLENTPPNIQWGVLTNGRKWRLYGTNDYETQTYYEVDLPELLQRGDPEAFKYFYAFFRPAAFRESAGTRFLDDVWSESETASQELGESLQDNVFTALRVLGRGFVETNADLDIDPDDEKALDELKEQSLVFLYRLMFVLYAESRGLIHPQNRSAKDEYDQNFSLDELRFEIHDTIGEVDEGFDGEFSDYSTTMWRRLEDLFRLIDEGEAHLGIPPYNGGLFDHEAHDFLSEHEVSNQYLAEVIYRLSTTRNDEGRYVLADYADLDTRHLGSVYEGLLEHQFRIAPEQYAAVAKDGGQVWKPATDVSVAAAAETVPEGGLYVVNDEGERKATGAYYTPDYVVTYIVEETVGPLVEEIREDLVDQGFEPGTQEYIGPFFRRVTDLRILDPAMGSGHFLTKATGYLSEQVMAEVREAEEEFGVAFDEQHIRREIAKECIYGVDLNGMAVELAKLSMWLETLAADRPLAFLDHHFKQGNSLVGSDIEAIEELESDASDDDDSQASLAEFGATREGTIERLMDIYGEFLAIENETVEDVHEMKRKYAKIERDELRRRLVAMANVRTAEKFELDAPSGAYEQMARALEDDGKWAKVENPDWFIAAQSMAEDRNFFHWKLAFPEVFYNLDGQKQENPGFDMVIGNPPYVLAEGIFKTYLQNQYSATQYKIDLFHAFIQRGIEVLQDQGEFGYIVPEPWLTMENTEALREYILESSWIQEVVRFKNDVFQEATVDTIILLLEKTSSPGPVSILEANNPDNSLTGTTEIRTTDQESLVNTEHKRIEIRQSTGEEQVLTKIERQSIPFKKAVEVSIGIQAYGQDDHTDEQIENRVFHADHRVSEDYVPELSGQDVSRYRIEHDGQTYVEYGKHLHREREEKYFTGPRILVREITGGGSHRIHAAYTDSDYINYKTILSIIPQSEYKPQYLVAVLNSKLISWVFLRTSNKIVTDTFPRISLDDIESLPLPQIRFDTTDETPEIDLQEKYHSCLSSNDIGPVEPLLEDEPPHPEVIHDFVAYLAEEMTTIVDERNSFNLSLLDYIQSYTEGPELIDIGTYQPPEGVGDTKLAATKEDYENIRVGTVTCEREDENTVTIHATARYKPDDETAHETDQWGYTETEPMPAMRLSDLSETEADLIEAFVPVAVEEAGGFAGFRETATKTNSLVDRLEAITLPDPDDVAGDLERYREAVERAAELDGKIQRTDDLIDAIVYDLYGLTDEEIEIVEEAVNAD
ncbi:Eco57I restriction-modification methylase domain-containing protein [Natronomonas sp. LN261]|uniref:Eco57I restriction-modification methylase domain-containing protein n=1 Tax=Natronomonas sp. LN261 TaxID=2750669 RepID=UPI0015EE487B|nr:N-6 DNA methylase [Natronomonas sp. LN261]